MRAARLAIARNTIGVLLVICSLVTTGHAEVAEDEGQEVEVHSSENKASSAMESPPNHIVLGRGGDSEIVFHLATWLRWNHQFDAGATESTLSIPLARPVVEASFFEGKLKAFVQEELAGAKARLLDAFVDVRLQKNTSLRIGQFRTPYSRAFPTPIIKLLLPDRGAIVDAFRLGRETGVMLHGSRNQGALEFYLGAFGGGTSDNSKPLATTPWPTLRVVYNLGAIVPYDQSPAAAGSTKSGVALGANAAYRRREVATELGMDATQVGWHVSGDVSGVLGALSATAEAFIRNQKTAEGAWQQDWGAYAQGGYFMIPRRFELAARSGWRQEETVAGSAKERTYEVGVNGYASMDGHAQGHHLKAMVRYALTQRTGAQMTTPKTSHLITVLGQLWF